MLNQCLERVKSQHHEITKRLRSTVDSAKVPVDVVSPRTPIPITFSDETAALPSTTPPHPQKLTRNKRQRSMSESAVFINQGSEDEDSEHVAPLPVVPADGKRKQPAITIVEPTSGSGTDVVEDHTARSIHQPKKMTKSPSSGSSPEGTQAKPRFHQDKVKSSDSGTERSEESKFVASPRRLSLTQPQTPESRPAPGKHVAASSDGASSPLPNKDRGHVRHKSHDGNPTKSEKRLSVELPKTKFDLDDLSADDSAGTPDVDSPEEPPKKSIINHRRNHPKSSMFRQALPYNTLSSQDPTVSVRSTGPSNLEARRSSLSSLPNHLNLLTSHRFLPGN